ncbi:MAG TPA: disulfide oxidoreductase [Lachnospiraceae bacterium]|nr:disulfide oxidoreductase [Lachnospiraceae bacterium]
MQTITKETLIGELLQIDMGVAAVLMNSGMHCVGCPSSQMESLEEACMVHGMDVNAVLKDIEKYFEEKEQ